MEEVKITGCGGTRPEGAVCAFNEDCQNCVCRQEGVNVGAHCCGSSNSRSLGNGHKFIANISQSCCSGFYSPVDNVCCSYQLGNALGCVDDADCCAVRIKGFAVYPTCYAGKCYIRDGAPCTSSDQCLSGSCSENNKCLVRTYSAGCSKAGRIDCLYGRVACADPGPLPCAFATCINNVCQ